MPQDHYTTHLLSIAKVTGSILVMANLSGYDVLRARGTQWRVLDSMRKCHGLDGLGGELTLQEMSQMRETGEVPHDDDEGGAAMGGWCQVALMPPMGGSISSMLPGL